VPPGGGRFRIADHNEAGAGPQAGCRRELSRSTSTCIQTFLSRDELVSTELSRANLAAELAPRGGITGPERSP
jgi:hypothetical protein